MKAQDSVHNPENWRTFEKIDLKSQIEFLNSIFKEYPIDSIIPDI